MVYLYTEKVYVCENCGSEFKRSEILDKGVKTRRDTRSLTKRQRIQEEFGDLLEEMENYQPDD